MSFWVNWHGYHLNVEKINYVTPLMPSENWWQYKVNYGDGNQLYYTNKLKKKVEEDRDKFLLEIDVFYSGNKDAKSTEQTHSD